MKRLIQKITVLAVAGFVLGILTSCIGTDSTVTINEDGSGSIQLSYTISKLISQLGRLEATDTTVPLPVNREDFERTVRRIPGLGFENYRETEDEENIIINTDLSFTSIPVLNEFLKGIGEDVISLVPEGTVNRLKFTIFPGREEALAADSAAVLADLFQDYSLNFTIITPSAIQELNQGTKSGDGKSANLQIPITKLLTNNDPVIWEMTW